MTIRRATSDDASTLSALATQIWLHTHAKQGVNNSIARYVQSELSEEAFQKLIADQDKTVLVAYRNRYMVAYAVLRLDSPCPDAPMIQTEVITFYVQEHCTHQGVGTALLAECLKRTSNDNGKLALWTSISTQNGGAVEFCRKQGMLLLGFSNMLLGTERHENFLLAHGDL
jgi:ribosomal protein S18 acetylase RimI-like enzyme